jgi:hypothetical protein
MLVLLKYHWSYIFCSPTTTVPSQASQPSARAIANPNILNPESGYVYLRSEILTNRGSWCTKKIQSESCHPTPRDPLRVPQTGIAEAPSIGIYATPSTPSSLPRSLSARARTLKTWPRCALQRAHQCRAIALVGMPLVCGSFVGPDECYMCEGRVASLPE